MKSLNNSDMNSRLLLFLACLSVSILSANGQEKRPNILFCIADDWGWPHASAYQNDEVVKTPAFDRIAKEGVLFNHAYVSSPSCTPSRNAILSGRYHWQLEGGANLWSTLDDKIETYPHLLDAAGLETPEQMDGMSFLPLAKGKSTEWRDYILYEYFWERNYPQTPTMHSASNSSMSVTTEFGMSMNFTTKKMIPTRKQI
ncbi:sulfatase-like hydrolase/transferase [Verrucomicrobiales bacterium]|nr:sulfatase-like hydrolase/transferase [Verrucomicrobiales bacterium]